MTTTAQKPKKKRDYLHAGRLQGRVDLPGVPGGAAVGRAAAVSKQPPHPRGMLR